MIYAEYATVLDVRSSYLKAIATTDDPEILRVIREVSDLIDTAAGRRHFVPRIETRYFDYGRQTDQARLLLDDDLLAVTTLTNGDTTVIASSKYVFMPRNETPYWALDLLASQGIVWTYTVDPERAISIDGIWGYRRNYADAWESLTTLGADLSNVATSATLAAGIGNPGELWKIDSEYLYLSARVTTTATIVRGVNGSTAVSHLNGASISRWIVDRRISGLCITAAAAFTRIREQSMNPTPEILVIDGHSFQTVKDVREYIRQQIAELGLSR